MSKIENAFDEYVGDPSSYIGYQKHTGYMIFDAKIGDNLCCKARFVANGHTTETPISITYITVVYWDYVKICLTIAAIKDISVLSDGVENYYLLMPM